MTPGDKKNNLPLSHRVRELFQCGRVERAMQVLRVEQMAATLGISENNVVRIYGLPEFLPIGEVVYLIGQSAAPADGEPVKIGYTKQTLRQRMESLQTGSVARLFLLAFQPGGRELEREIHDRLFYAQIREDWFEMCDDVREEFWPNVGEVAA